MHSNWRQIAASILLGSLVVLVVAGCSTQSSNSETKPGHSSPITVARTSEIVVINADGSNAQTIGPRSNFSASPTPHISPNEQEVLFSYEACDGCKAELATMPFNSPGNSFRKLSEGDNPRISPDSAHVVY